MFILLSLYKIQHGDQTDLKRFLALFTQRHFFAHSEQQLLKLHLNSSQFLLTQPDFVFKGFNYSLVFSSKTNLHSIDTRMQSGPLTIPVKYFLSEYLHLHSLDLHLLQKKKNFLEIHKLFPLRVHHPFQLYQTVATYQAMYLDIPK